MTPLPDPGWRTIENALVVPPVGDGRPALGAYDAEGRFLPETATLLSHGQLSKPAEPPTAAETYVAGQHFYAGLGRTHFGHFLLESAVRFWALHELKAAPDSIVFTPLPKSDLRGALGKSLRDLYAGLSGGLPHISVKEPTRFERLTVATPGFGHRHWISGTQKFRSHIANCFYDDGPFEGPDKLYISRSALREARQRVDQEPQLEAVLKDAGYTIFHPQSHDLGTQIEHYRSARTILGGDGSAFHLLAFVARPDTRVGMIQRRNRPEVIDLLSRQLQAFSGITPDSFDPTLPLDEQRALVPKGANAPTPINLNSLIRDLRQTGFI